MIEDKLFPFTDRFMQMIFANSKRTTGIDKELTPKTLRHTHVVRAIKGERVLRKSLIGLDWRRIQDRKRRRCIDD